MPGALGGEGWPELTVVGDQNMLGRAVENLLGNAIFYSGDGGRIEVKLSVMSGSVARISVSDNGPGGPEDALF